MKSKSPFTNNFRKRSALKGCKICLAGLLLFITGSVYSQEKWDDLFPVDDIYFKNWGWLAGAGINYTIPTSGNSVLESDTIPDLFYSYALSPKGKVGAMLEGGAFYLLDNPVVSYLDAGIRMNWYNGKEDFTLDRVSTIDNSTLPSQSGYRSFSFLNASLRINANNTIQISKYEFIQNSIGLNVDYTFYESQEIDPPLLPLTDFEESFQMQLHYKLSYGFRLDLMHYMIVGVDTPILTLVDWDGGKPSFEMFNSTYLPITLSVQFLFLQKSNRPDCKKPPPLDMNKKRKKAKMF